MTLTKLREIAMAATPGQWVKWGDCATWDERSKESYSRVEVHARLPGDPTIATTNGLYWGTNHRNNAEHIATFSPAMVLKLLEVVDCALELQEIFAPGFVREHIDCFTIQPMNTALAALKGTE